MTDTDIRPIRWGLIGAGRIAHRFAQGLAHVPHASVGAVWSRRAEPADALAREHGALACASVEALFASGIDAVYVATLQDSHADYAIAALRAGLPVLCEKPATINGAQLERVLDAARDAQRLFMEAMKTPFYPLYRRLREHLARDPVGDVGLVRAGCSVANVPASHPSFSFEHAGGALLDIGVYEMFLATDWLGAPLDVQTIGRLGPTGVDTFASLNCRHERGIAQLFCGLDLHGYGDALLAGPLGHVTIHANWWNPVRATIRYADGRMVELDEPFEGGGLNYETAHFCDLLRAGERESPVVTHDTSRRMIAMADAARAALGLRFAGE
ncbi:Gfo/Idh/MocA family protein [Paraburkholderia caballeronis]|uniref:Predicted dehydrogenase n=1 Tax=Paraburkholderia caballeronis TaxID=416943 RepID=A0A1H7JXI8_9BURK|nr:Gfo/Idh/MocA family oxidoreductase [Paraburkholderia caballeronis]PXW27255.1 putative dehydrogenase [Paraburkholderia caballeronis]PXX02729.1 putative dehydrogenase [Paraburkholderia caballeronis]RAK03454.1 putative dehydrogenase [Paraburkholderia caballeronis]SEC39752.1 Predicted dehydrogenase [Paraburkholderia caballeronis]SEK78487.1 Predicted dehydrogenase [Paraburkholderia caballeronis]